MKTFYLAHSIQLLETVRRWQLMMEGKFKIKFINPFFNNPNEKTDDLSAIKSNASLMRYLDSLPLDRCFKIMEHDLTLIRKSDGLVAYFDSPTIGTCQEIIMAGYVYRIPVYVITKRYYNHPWIRAIVDRSGGCIFKNRTQFKKFVQEEFGCRI
jgi:nucleoside 2-deoxyribosyltransferase